MATDIGDELYALCGANQCTAFVFLGQGEIVADLGHLQCMAHIAWPLHEQDLPFALIKRFIKVYCNWELAVGLLQLKT